MKKNKKVFVKIMETIRNHKNMKLVITQQRIYQVCDENKL